MVSQLKFKIIDLFIIPDLNRLAFEITGQILKNRRLDTALEKLKTNLGEILTNIKFRTEIEGAEFILNFGKLQRDPWELLKSSLKYIDSFALKHKKKICFAFDEFGDVEKLDGNEIIKLFRGIIQSQKQSVFLFSGSYESVMNKLFVSSKAPFYRTVKIIQPGYLEEPDLIKFLKVKFGEMGVKVSDEDIIKGIEFTGGHPYYIRLFIQEYYFLYLQDQKLPDIAQIFEKMLDSENNYLEKLWDEISSKREIKLVLLRIIETGKPYSGIEIHGVNISRAIKDLSGKGFIYSRDSSWFLTDPLFEKYVRNRILKIAGN